MKKQLCLLLIVCSFNLFSENYSTVEKIELLQNFENLEHQKYPQEQLLEIKQNLQQLDKKIRVVSFNILFDRYDHKLPEEYKWEQRLPRVIKAIDNMQPDILNIQEVYPNQLQDLLTVLENDYAYYGKSSPSGDLNCIFYRKHRFKLIKGQAFGLDKTKNPKVLNMVQLKDKITGADFAVFNTHLTYRNVENRYTEAKCVRAYIEKVCKKIPVIFAGDFNTFPNRPDKSYPFYDGDYIQKILVNNMLVDAKNCSLLGHVGPICTFTNTPGSAEPFTGLGSPSVYLDHIFVSPKIKVLIHGVNSEQIGGYFPSDHMPVIADILIPTKL